MTLKERTLELAKSEMEKSCIARYWFSNEDYYNALSECLQILCPECVVKVNPEFSGNSNWNGFKYEFILPKNAISVVVSEESPYCSWSVDRKLIFANQRDIEVDIVLFDESLISSYPKMLTESVSLQMTTNKIEEICSYTVDFYQEKIYILENEDG